MGRPKRLLLRPQEPCKNSYNKKKFRCTYVLLNIIPVFNTGLLYKSNRGNAYCKLFKRSSFLGENQTKIFYYVKKFEGGALCKEKNLDLP